MEAGLEVGRLVAQYEAVSEAKEGTEHACHYRRSTKMFLENIEKLFYVSLLSTETARACLHYTQRILITVQPSAAELISTHCDQRKSSSRISRKKNCK